MRESGKMPGTGTESYGIEKSRGTGGFGQQLYRLHQYGYVMRTAAEAAGVSLHGRCDALG